MKRLLDYLLAIVLLLTLTGCLWSHKPDNSSDSPTIPIAPIVHNLDISSELVEIHEKDGLLRIESIQPGLDTCDLTVTLWSVADKKDVATVKLGEDSWQTGWTEDGFYAISLLKKTAYFYDRSGQRVREISLPQEMRSLGLALCNEAGDTFLLNKAETAELLLYFPESTSLRSVGNTVGGASPVGYADGSFYVRKNETGELLCVAEDGEKAVVPYVSRESSFFTPHLGISSTETNFRVHRSYENAPLYVPFRAVDELPLAANKDCFLTVTSTAEEDILYLYDIKQKTVGTLSVPSHAIAAQYTTDGRWMITIKSGNQYSVHFYASSTFKESPLTILTQDKPTTATAPSQSTQGTVPAKKVVLSVPVLSQWPEYPTGCESVSTVMALRYAGEDITVSRFIDTYLPRSSAFYFENGVKYGPNPYEVFIGSPRTSASYGCMASVIEKALTAYFGTSERIQNTSGYSLPALCRDYVDKGTPVLVWVTISMLESYPSASWHLEDGSLYTWPANEHCMVLVGHDANNYYFNDPYKGAVVGYPHTLCETRYEELGRQSLSIR